LPFAGRDRAAIAVIDAPFRANRCFAFGYFLPVNSKKADAGTTQRVLSAKCRALRAKVEDRRTAGPSRWKTERHGNELDFVASGAHDGTDLVDPNVVNPWKIVGARMPRNPERHILHHLAVAGPAHVLLIVVTHVTNVGWSRSSRKAGSYGG
jgi:hypothetical protein